MRWILVALVMLWAGPAAAWTWADLRAALPPEIVWSAARETPEAAEEIVLRGPEGTLRVARWARAGDIDLLDMVRVEEADGGWTEIGRLEIEGLDLPGLLRALSRPDPEPFDLLRAGVHREIRASRMASSAGVSLERLASFGLTEEGVWGGMRIEGLSSVDGQDWISLALAEIRGLDVRGLLADPTEAARRAFGLVSVRLEGVAAAVEGASGRLERFSVEVGRADGRWSRLETGVVGLVMAVPPAAPPPVRDVVGEMRELRLDARRLQAEGAPGRWLDDSEVVVAGQAALRWRLEADAPEGFGDLKTVALRALRLEVEDLGIGARLRAVFPAEADRLRRVREEIGLALRGLGVPAPAAAEMLDALSAMLTGNARAAWIEGRVEAPLPIGALMEGEIDALAAHVADWMWRAGRRP
jgi:hypothetical protein